MIPVEFMYENMGDVLKSVEHDFRVKQLGLFLGSIKTRKVARYTKENPTINKELLEACTIATSLTCYNTLVYSKSIIDEFVERYRVDELLKDSIIYTASYVFDDSTDEYIKRVWKGRSEDFVNRMTEVGNVIPDEIIDNDCDFFIICNVIETKDVFDVARCTIVGEYKDITEILHDKRVRKMFGY